MKKTSIALFDLIQSLTMAEKKYFKMFSSLKGGDKSYLKLYHAIEKQNTYNEDAIRSACRGEKFLRQLPVAKNRLYNNILRSLENYHGSTDMNLRSRISKAEVLLRKGLPAQTLQLLKTAKPIAYRYERWELLMEMLVMERTPYAAVDVLTMSHLNKEIEAVLKKLNNINEYRIIHHKITYQNQETEFVRTQNEQLFIEQLIQHPLVRDEKQASCAEAKTYYYEIWSLYHLYKKEFIKGYETAKEQCEFIETHSHLLRVPEKRFLFALNISLIFIGYLLPFNKNMYGKMQKVLHKIRAYPASYALKNTFWLAHSYINELNAFMQVGGFEKVFPVLKAIEANKDVANQAAPVTKMNLYYNISYMLFGAGSYNKALNWIRKIIDQPANAFRKDTQAYARILYLLIHYELRKDEQILDSLKRSTHHFLSSRKRLFKVEKALLDCLHQITGKAISKKERNAVLKKLKKTLLKLEKDPMEKVAMEEFDFLSWVESKLENRSFANIVKEKLKLAWKVRHLS